MAVKVAPKLAKIGGVDSERRIHVGVVGVDEVLSCCRGGKDLRTHLSIADGRLEIEGEVANINYCLFASLVSCLIVVCTTRGSPVQSSRVMDRGFQVFVSNRIASSKAKID